MAERIPEKCGGRLALSIANGGRKVVYGRCDNRPSYVMHDLCGTYYYCDECKESQP